MVKNNSSIVTIKNILAKKKISVIIDFIKFEECVQISCRNLTNATFLPQSFVYCGNKHLKEFGYVFLMLNIKANVRIIQIEKIK